MPEMITRAFEPELEVLSRAQGGDGRTIVGLAVPYNRPQRIDSRLTEQFARGAFNKQIKGAAERIRSGALSIPFGRGHLPMGGTLIGRALMLRDDPAGLYGEWRVSQTAAGDETLELVRDGALSHLSIGFVEGHNRQVDNGVTERVTAQLREVAIVIQGAYGDNAAVTDVRRGENELQRQQLDKIRHILDDAKLSTNA